MAEGNDVDRGQVDAISIDEIENIPLDQIVAQKMGESVGSPPVSPEKEEVPVGKENPEKVNESGEELIDEAKESDVSDVEEDIIKFDPKKVQDIDAKVKQMNKHFTQTNQKNAELKRELEAAIKSANEMKSELSLQQQKLLNSVQGRTTQPQQPSYVPTDADYLRMYEQMYGRLDSLALEETKSAAIAIAKERYAHTREIQNLQGQLATLTANQYQGRYNDLIKDFGLSKEDKKRHEYTTMALMKTGLSMEEAIALIPRPERVDGKAPVELSISNKSGGTKDNVVEKLKGMGAWDDIKNLALVEFRKEVEDKRKTLPPTSTPGESISSPKPKKEESFSLDSDLSIEDQIAERLTKELERNMSS